MRPLPYRVFLWIFAVSNAIVWFLLLSGLGLFLHSHLAQDGRVGREIAPRAICLGLLLPTVLALQGAIVNLRVQFLVGRFVPPADTGGAAGRLRNPWRVSLRAALAIWAVLFVPLFAALSFLLPESLDSRTFVPLMAGIGAVLVLLLAVIVADREFRRYLPHLNQPSRAALAAPTYAVWRIAVPWGVVNLLINAILAWIGYSGGVVEIMDLRGDLVVMTFLISVCMALSALPEVEMDVHRNAVQLPAWLPSMPRLWVRYAYALGFASLVYALLTPAMTAVGLSTFAMPVAVLIKAITAGLVAAGAAGTCALWGLGRCADRRAERLRLEAMTPATVP